jgi:hypothetical protein
MIIVIYVLFEQSHVLCLHFLQPLAMSVSSPHLETVSENDNGSGRRKGTRQQSLLGILVEELVV